MLASLIVEPLRAAAGVMVTLDPKVPRPMTWLVLVAWLARFVLYSVNQSMYALVTMP